MGPPDEKKPFWMVPFTIHATRGILREQRARRALMICSLGGALLLLLAGSTVLAAPLREHPFWFLLFWGACAWITFLAFLLALLDMLLLRAKTRAEQKQLARKHAPFAETDREE